MAVLLIAPANVLHAVSRDSDPELEERNPEHRGGREARERALGLVCGELLTEQHEPRDGKDQRRERVDRDAQELHGLETRVRSREDHRSASVSSRNASSSVGRVTSRSW